MHAAGKRDVTSRPSSQSALTIQALALRDGAKAKESWPSGGGAFSQINCRIITYEPTPPDCDSRRAGQAASLIGFFLLLYSPTHALASCTAIGGDGEWERERE